MPASGISRTRCPECKHLPRTPSPPVPRRAPSPGGPDRPQETAATYSAARTRGRKALQPSSSPAPAISRPRDPARPGSVTRLTAAGRREDLLGREFRANPRLRAGALGPARARGAPRARPPAGRSGFYGVLRPRPEGAGRGARRQGGRPRHGPPLPHPARARAAAVLRAVGPRRGGRPDGRAAGGGRRPRDRAGRGVRLRRRPRSQVGTGGRGGRGPARRAVDRGPALRPGAGDRRSPPPLLPPLRLQPPAADAALAEALLRPRGRAGAIWGSGPAAPTGSSSTARGAPRRLRGLAELAVPGGRALPIRGERPGSSTSAPRPRRWPRGSAPSSKRSPRRGPRSSRSAPEPPGCCGRTRSSPTSPSFERLAEAARAVESRLGGVAAQGVPFTSEIAGDGLLSWGMDPPATERDAWGGRESWRLWLTHRLARALLAARSAGEGIEPWRFALERLRLEGVDTGSWTPAASLWGGDLTDGDHRPRPPLAGRDPRARVPSCRRRCAGGSIPTRGTGPSPIRGRAPPRACSTRRSAALLGEFKSPRTIVDAVIRYSQARDLDPESTLVEAYPLLERLLAAGFLVTEGSDEAGGIAALARARRADRGIRGAGVRAGAGGHRALPGRGGRAARRP